jgi:hypothetical protein
MLEQNNVTERERKSKEALHDLAEQLARKLPSAFDSPIGEIELFVLDMGGRNQHGEKVRQLLAKLENATIPLSLGLIADLSENDFRKFKVLFKALVIQQYELKGRAVPATLEKVLDPNAPQNLIQHEWEHTKPLPSVVRDQGKMEITFITETPGGLPISGAPIYDLKNVSLRMLALAASEPASLSGDDQDIARSLAEKTGDPLLAQEVEDRIKARLSH